MGRVRVAWLARHAHQEVDAYLRSRLWHWATRRNYALAADYVIHLLNRHPRDPLALVLGEVAGHEVNESTLAEKCKEASRRLCFIKGTDDILTLLKEDATPSQSEVRMLLEDVKHIRAANAERGAVSTEKEDEHIIVKESAPLPETRRAVQRACTRVHPVANAELLEPNGSVYGRGLYAAQRLSPRTVILVEDPLLTQRQDEKCCAHCLVRLSHSQRSAEAALGVRCPHCADESYCSTDCQEAAWAQYHACCCESVNPSLAAWMRSMADTMYHSAGAAPSDSFMDAGSHSRAALSCLAVAKVCAMATIQQCHPLALQGINSLRGTASYEPTRTLNEVGALAVALSSFLRQSQLYMEEVLSLFAILQSNEFLVSGGIAVYPVLSLLNHSCDPNSTIVGSGTRNRQLVVLRDIRDGEQLFINYNSSLTMALGYEQRKALCAQRHFECFCSKCVRRV